MKIYKPKKWLTIIRIISIFAIFICFSKSTLSFVTKSSVKDTNSSKSLEVAVIDESWENLYKEELYIAESTFVGDLTAYVGDCPLCSGILACHPRTNVLEEGIYFEDDEYGTVRIVATSRNYPCGTILRFSSNRLGEEPIIAIAMDRGVTGNDVDILVDDVNFAYKVGRTKNMQFEVLRTGW